jgi:hypothetical protein
MLFFKQLFWCVFVVEIDVMPIIFQKLCYCISISFFAGVISDTRIGTLNRYSLSVNDGASWKQSTQMSTQKSRKKLRKALQNVNLTYFFTCFFEKKFLFIFLRTQKIYSRSPAAKCYTVVNAVPCCKRWSLLLC